MSAPDAEVQAARAYEALHVDALFRQWVDPVLDAADVTSGDRVLDVACGTGVLARAALARVAPDGQVTGLDLAAGMLTVAEEIEPAVRWVEGAAGDLPFPDDAFDAVVSQFGLMFFPDRVRAVREMLRCARPGGRVVVAVWEALERSEAYPEAVDLLLRRAGVDAAEALRAPFALGDPAELAQVFADAGVPGATVATLRGTARFPGVRSMVEADLRGWLPVMGVHLGDALVVSILEEAESVLARYVEESGEMVFDAPAHVVTVTV